MPLILVVEQEQRYVERIEEALGPQGWEVVGVDDRAAAMRLVADRAADLVVVNAEVSDASELVGVFARANGGPGAVVLVPESGDNGTVQEAADEVLRKPFTDQDIRLAVRRCLAATRQLPEEVSDLEHDPGEVLSSEDIFGDVVLELEGAFNLGGVTTSGSGESATVEVPAEELAVSPQVPEVSPEAEETEVSLAAEQKEPAEATVFEDEEPPEPVEVEAAEVDEAVETIAEVEDEIVAASVEEVEAATVSEEIAEEEEVEAEEAEAEEEGEAASEEEGEEQLAEEVVEEEAVAAMAPEIEDEKPKKRPEKKLLEERLREAVVAGKAMAAKQSRPVRSDSAAQAADLLLQKALGTLSAETRAAAKIDARFAEPAHATEKEVDDLVRTVVGKKTADVTPAEAVAEMDDRIESGQEAPVLDVMESELIDSDDGEYRTRMKILWAIILVVLLALVVFIITRSSSEQSTPEPASPVGALEPDSASGHEMLATDVTADEGQVGPTEPVDGEQRLRQELEAEKRQLQAEILQTQENGRESDNEEGGGGV